MVVALEIYYEGEGRFFGDLLDLNWILAMILIFGVTFGLERPL